VIRLLSLIKLVRPNVPDGGKGSDLENVPDFENELLLANPRVDSCARLLVKTELRLNTPVKLNTSVIDIPSVLESDREGVKVLEPVNAAVDANALDGLNRSESVNPDVIERFTVINISPVELK
jgi:hypothetical protein